MAEILLADDHPAILLGIKTYLEQKGHTISTVCTNGIEAYNQILIKHPAIALLDISMPGMTGIEIARKISQMKIRSKLVLLTLDNEYTTYSYAKQLGVKGFLLKEFAMEEIDQCINALEKGETYFSTRLHSSLHIGHSSRLSISKESLTFSERKILQLIGEQKSSKEIASMLFISEKTVETHRAHIIKKLNIPSGKNALLKWAIEHNNKVAEKNI